MAIHVHDKTTNVEGQDVLPVDIYNGELEALDAIMEKWKFKDYKSALQYAIAILKLSEIPKLYLLQNEELKGFSPSKDLIKQPLRSQLGDEPISEE